LRHRWRSWCSDIRGSYTYGLLQRVESVCDQAASRTSDDPRKRTWLLQFRRELRPILEGFDSRCNNGEVDIVRYYLLTCSQRMIPICVWLIGRFADRMHLYELTTFRHSRSPQLRRHVAKALRRLEGWSYLRDMAKANPGDARIQWYATAPTVHGPFAERLRKYKSHVKTGDGDDVAAPAHMPFWSLEKHWSYTPTKSVLYIRRILRRIRRRVRWGMG
jgi:hypothetical protein